MSGARTAAALVEAQDCARDTGTFALQALTVYQPWAQALALGIKSIETRSWPTRHRGLLAIHAGSYIFPGNKYCQDLLDNIKDIGGDIAPLAGISDWPRGAIIAVGRLVDCLEMVKAPSMNEAGWGVFGTGRYGWVLDDAIQLPSPIITPGKQGLWRVDDGHAHAIARQVRQVMAHVSEWRLAEPW